MPTLGKSLFLAVVSLFNPRMLWLMLWPVLVALVFWFLAAWMFWARASGWIAAQLGALVHPVMAYVPFDLTAIMALSAHVMLFVLFVPVVYLTALLILAIFGMDAMVDHVAARHYPNLVRKRGGSTSFSVASECRCVNSTTVRGRVSMSSTSVCDCLLRTLRRSSRFM